MSPSRRTLLAGLCAPLLAACSSWHPVRRTEDWTLYVKEEPPAAVDAYERSLDAAHALVERQLGPFERRVRVHAWQGGVSMESGNKGEISHGGDGLQEEIPGIGPARVRAFHTSPSISLFGPPSGVFVGTPDCGTVVHELVHARLAEERLRVPLWFEEGYATLLGDGILQRGEWVVDGLATWPWRELREESLSDDDLRRLMAIRPDDDHTVRENVLLHFLGWAVVFDLHRELGTLEWRPMLARLTQSDDLVAEVRARMERTLDDDTPIGWLESRRRSPAAERLAAVKGTWKLYSPAVADWLLGQLGTETDPEVRGALAVNLLAVAAELESDVDLQLRIWRTLPTVMRDVDLPIPAERQALHALYRAYQYGTGDGPAQEAFNGLVRFWED